MYYSSSLVLLYSNTTLFTREFIMSDLLVQSWNKSLLNNDSFTIPLYSGSNLDSSLLTESVISPSMVLLRDKLQSKITELVNKLADEYKFDNKYMIVDKLVFEDTINSLDEFTTVKLTYRVMNGTILHNRKTIDLITYPKVTDKLLFKIKGSYYTITDEVVNDYSINYHEATDYKSLKLQLESGITYELRKYFEGTEVLVVRHYKTIIDSLVLSDSPLTETTIKSLLTSNPLTVVLPKLSRFLDIDELDDYEVLMKLFNSIDGSVFMTDDIRTKRIISAYNVLLTYITDSIKYHFYRSRKIKDSEIKPTRYKSILARLYGNSSFYFISDTNPISILSSKRKLNKMGPNGPSVSNLAMRDYNPSYVDYIDPVETPESNQLGLTIHRALACTYDESGSMSTINGLPNGSSSLNLSALTIPFIQNNDSVRVSMASGHIKQALPLTNPDKPLVSTGSDRLINDLFNYDSVVSPIDGEVVNINSTYITISNGTITESVRLPEPLLGNEYTMSTYKFKYSVGDKVSKGSVLVNSNNFNDGYLTLGKNVLIAYMPYKGLNYEDSVVISESLASKLTSEKGYTIEYNNDEKEFSYENLPLVGDKVVKGQVLVSYRDKQKKVKLIDLYSSEEKSITYPKSGKVVHIDILDRDNLPTILGNHSKVVITVSVTGSVKIGDKFSFTSASKCTVSKILPDDQMPRTHDNRVVDIIYNTIGIPSRMNIGQLLEAGLGAFNVLYREKLNTYDNDSKDLVINDLQMMYNVTKASNLLEFIKFIEPLPNEDYIKVLNSLKNHFVFEVKQFDNTITKDTITNLFSMFGFDSIIDPTHGKQLYLPDLDNTTKFPVFYGYSRLLVLKHRTEDKSTVMSLSGLSDNKEKAQKVGEMEMLALEAHGASHFINELSLIRSNQSVKVKVLRDLINTTNPNGLINLNNYKKDNSSYDEFKVLFRAMNLKVTNISN